MRGSMLAQVAAVMIVALWARGETVLAQTPEETKAWEAQRDKARAEEKARAEQLARERAARKADPMAWVRTLDPMPSGGWTFRSVAPDGSWAAFSTDHQLKRSGHEVTAWLRQEYPEAQHTGGGDSYFSDVEKIEYDCSRERARVLEVDYYAQNNLAGAQQNEQIDVKQAPWGSIVPGTQSETVFRWACAPGSR
ncbi:MAG TPA: surface-adhesin E family protein [Steroidobacteraceae bacterium]|nr:surface-adhesin E family protein [Steroidobacteraceae bacterium]